jgi:hypothetical protein
MEPAVDFYPHFLEGLKSPVDAAHYLVESMEAADREKDYLLFFKAINDVRAAGNTMVEVFKNVPPEEMPNFEERFNCMAVKLAQLLREHPISA